MFMQAETRQSQTLEGSRSRSRLPARPRTISTVMQRFHPYFFERLGTRTMHLSPGEGFFIDGRTPHAYGSGPGGWVFGSVSLAGRLLSLYYARYASSGSPPYLRIPRRG